MRHPLRVRLPLLAALAAIASPSVSAPPPRPRVVLVAWDGADWSLLDQLVREGKMPALASLVRKGRTWNLSTYQPMASPLIWTTVATGRNPVDHGIRDFQELDPKTRARLPISGRSRLVPAIWNVASAKGTTVGVVNWWATWPAEKVSGFLVSDRAAPVLFDPDALSRSPAVAWPEGLADGVRIVVKREGSPSFEDVARSLPVSRAQFDAAVAARKDLADPITGFRKILGVTRVAARIALELYDRQKPELLMVYFQGTDEIGHVLGRFHPPPLPGTSAEEARLYANGVAAIYVEADRALGELAARAERDGATLVLLSDHGFKWGDERPRSYSGVQFDTAFLWHRGPGVLAASGPGVAPSAKRDTASVFDVAPTLCRLLGLPADPAFEGKPIPGIVPGKDVPAVRPAAWSKLAKVERLAVGEMGAEERKAADEFTKKLISLGYLTGAEAGAVDARPADRAGTETAGSLSNAGTYLRGLGKAEESLPWYRKALEVNPKSASAWMNLSVALHMTNRWDESDDALVTAAVNGSPDPEATLFRRVATYMQLGEKNPRARPQLVAFLRKVVAAFPANDRYKAALGKTLFEGRDCAAAEAIFRDLVSRAPNDVDTLNVLALSSLCLGNVDEARRLFQRSLAVKPDQPAVREGLSGLEKGGSAPPKR